MSLNHEEHHELTGKAAWDWVESEAAAKAAAEAEALAEVVARAPSFE